MQDKIDDEHVGESPPSPTAPSKFDRASFLRGKIKAGIKDVFDRDGHDTTEDADKASDLFNDAAYSLNFDPEPDEDEHTSLRSKMHRSAGAIAATLKNPRRAFRSKYARTVAGNLSTQPDAYEGMYDGDVVEAYDEFERATSAIGRDVNSDISSGRTKIGNGGIFDDEHIHTTTDMSYAHADPGQRKIMEARIKYQEIEARRESLRAAWILGRHVRRVRVARPMVLPPVKSDFIEKSPDNQQQHVQWHRYLARVALWYTQSFTASHIDDFDEPPFNLKDLSLSIERLAVVSASLQSFLIEVRSIYLWNDPRWTSVVMVGYWVLWYYQHIMTAVFASIAVLTIRNKLYPTRIETIRSRVLRAQDNQARAQAWGELIQRHGKHDWVEPLLDQMGPLLQLELGDLANLLETLEAFYRWERPSKTAATLFFFVACLLVSVLGDMVFCVKLIWAGAGLFFFVTLPLSAKYPKYRKLFNPIYWVFWDIPNSAELAIAQLQTKAVMRDAARLDKATSSIATDSSERASWFVDNISTDEEDEEYATASEDGIDTLQSIRDHDQFTFSAVDSKNSLRGQLQLMRQGFWYFDKKQELYYPYSRLMEMRKVDISMANDPDASRMARVARRIQKSTSLQFLPAGIEFFFLRQTSIAIDENTVSRNRPCPPIEEQLALTVSESDRDKIFSLVLSWSNVKWQPLFSLNTRSNMSPDSANPAEHARGNKNLDHAIKSFAHHDG